MDELFRQYIADIKKLKNRTVVEEHLKLAISLAKKMPDQYFRHDGPDSGREYRIAGSDETF